MDQIRKIREEVERWEKGCEVDSLPSAESEMGEPLKVLYTPADVAEADYLDRIGFPGMYPFTRGIYPGMYRKNLWQMRLYAGFGTAEDTNQRWKFLLASGNNGVGCAFDLPTQMGLDSDDPRAEDEVGRVGVAIDTLKDMEMMYDGLPLDRIASSFNINAPGAIILAMYVAIGQKQGVPPSKLSGTLANDLLCEYVSRGMWVFPPKPSLKIAADIVEYCTREMPRFYPFNIRGIVMREAGATMAQEVGYSFCNATEYVREVLERGIGVDEFAPRISFFFCSGLHFLEEAAKYRAARRLWARIMKEKFGAQKPASMLLRATGMIGGSYYRPKELETNLIRGAYGLLGNVLGGLQGMLHPAMDEPFAIPTEKTAHLALRTQQICAYETGITETVDPLGGSYYIEALTDQIEQKIEGVMRQIDEMGGAVRAIEMGFMQKNISSEAYKVAQEELCGKKIVVGVNKFLAEDKRGEMAFYEFNPEVFEKQIQRLKQVRAERRSSEVQSALDAVRTAAEKGENLMPPLIQAIKTYASVGEIMKSLKEVYGEFREPITI